MTDLRCECDRRRGEIAPGVFLAPMHVTHLPTGDDFRCLNQADGEDGLCDSCRQAGCR
jgi:hypothetical protein